MLGWIRVMDKAACGGTVLYPALDAVTSAGPDLLVPMLLTITYDPRVPLARFYLNSIIVSYSIVTMVLFTSSLAGYAFAKLKFPKRDIIFYFFLAAMMVPGQAILIPMFTFLKDIGLLNTRTGLALSMTGGAIAFAIFLMRAFFRSLPSELSDAGKIDGCARSSDRRRRAWRMRQKTWRPRIGGPSARFPCRWRGPASRRWSSSSSWARGTSSCSRPPSSISPTSRPSSPRCTRR